MKASVEGLKSIGMQALEYAKDKILMGAERRRYSTCLNVLSYALTHAHYSFFGSVIFSAEANVIETIASRSP